MNGKEWPYLVGGSIVAAINGAVFPVFSIIFAEMLAVYFLPKGKDSSEKFLTQ